MDNSMETLLDRVEKALDLIETLETDKKELRKENSRLKAQLSKSAKAYNSVILEKTDHKEKVKSRLIGILDRIATIESMTG